MPKFFAKSSQIQIDLYPLSADHQFVSPDGRSNFKLKTNAILFSHYSTACTTQSAYSLIGAPQIKFTNGVAYLAGPTAEGKLAGVLKTDENGFKYLCVE